MKKFLSIILVLCLVFVGAAFAGCGVADNILSGKPDLNESVLGNGGLVVQKGDYIYFASGFVDSNKLGQTFSNAKGSVTNGALYRAKIQEVKNDEDDTFTKELTDTKLMVSKIVGFKDGGLYIFKDKIYFSSPSIVQDSSGIRYDLITFFSCNLDGSNLKEFYQTKTWKKDVSLFKMTMINEKVYLLISNGNEVLRIDEKGNKKTLAAEATSIVFSKYENVLNIQENPIINEQFIYYTKDTETEGPISLGQTLYKVDIVTGTETEIFKDSNNKIKIKLTELKSGRIFYTRTSEFSDELSYYSNSLEGNSFLNSELRHTYNSFTNLTSLGKKDENHIGIAFINNNKLYAKPLNLIDEVTTLASSVSSVLGVHDGYIYYVSGSDIYRVDTTKNTPSSEGISGDLTPLKTFCDWGLDFCYFFAEDADVASGYSMYMLDLDGLANKTSIPQKMI